MKRKWFASLLAICMLILLIPASAFASDTTTSTTADTTAGVTNNTTADATVATVSSSDGTTTVSYSTVEDAIKNANNGDTVTILATPQAGASTITIDKAITIQGQGDSKPELKDFVFNIQSANQSNPISVTFDNLSFTGTSQIRVGDINSSNKASSLTVNNCYAKLEYKTRNDKENAQQGQLIYLGSGYTTNLDLTVTGCTLINAHTISGEDASPVIMGEGTNIVKATITGNTFGSEADPCDRVAVKFGRRQNNTAINISNNTIYGATTDTKFFNILDLYQSGSNPYNGLQVIMNNNTVNCEIKGDQQAYIAYIRNTVMSNNPTSNLIAVNDNTVNNSSSNIVNYEKKTDGSEVTPFPVAAAKLTTADSTTYYATVTEAVNAAGADGGTITLLQDAPNEGISISGKSNLTIDGNRHALYSVNLQNNEGITLKNISFTLADEQHAQAIQIGASGTTKNDKITISNCSFTLPENAPTGTNPWSAIYVQTISSNLTIENNIFTLNRPDAKNFQCIGFAFTPDMRATDATIKGNTVTANNTKNTAYFVIGGDAASDNQYGLKNLTISNNTLTASNTGELIGARIANSDKLTVNGNIFNCTTGVRLSATNGIASKDITITNNNGSAKTMIELKGAQPIVSGFITDVPADKISFSEGSDKYNIKVAFDANGGNCDVATSVLPLSNGAASMDALPTPTRNGYTFDGWFTAADGGEQVSAPATFKETTTLYAHWSKQYTGGGSTVIPTPEPEEPSDSEETVTNPDGSTTTTITKEDGSSSTTTVGTDGTVESEVTVSKDAVDNADGSAVTLPMPEVPVTTDKTTAPTVTINLPSKDATKVEVPVKDVTAGTVAVLVDADGNETVIKDTVQSDNGITVEVTDGTTIKVVDNSKTFDDVADNYWGADAIDFATSRELFAGTAENTFSPEGDMTRAMIWSVLARYEGADIPGGTGDTWYAGPQKWAMENGISDGTMPNNSMTREQFAAMLYRYVGSPAVSGSVGNYSDADSISSWAQDAMVWAVQQGLIAGMDDGTLNPQGTATRTQVAAIFQRFIENKMA